MNDQTEKKVRIRRLIIIIIALLALIAIIISLYFGFGLNKKLKDAGSLKNLIEEYGRFSRFFYIILHIIQTTIIPITNLPTIIAGTLIFEPFEVFVLTTIGVWIGSFLSFSFGKLFGKKAVYWVLGEKTVDKYLGLGKGREKVAIFLMLLLPSFPDDIICIIAGITQMTWKQFAITIVLTRSIPTLIMVYTFNSIPDLLWWQTAIIIIVYIALFFILSWLITKKWDKITELIDKIKARFSKKDHH